MRKINIPNIEFTKIFDDCISNVRVLRKTKFQTRKSGIVTFSEEYLLRAQAKNLHQCSVDTGYIDLTISDFIFLYKSKMVPANQPGRTHYEKLLLASPNQMCPYCDSSPVEELDHVLVKKYYSRFSIVPINLVPSCGWCNKKKKEKVISKKSDLHFHPYFDEEQDQRWLYARVIPDDKIILFEFFIQSVPGWDVDENKRIKTHFETFKLKEKFSVLAASTVLDDTQLPVLFDESPEALRKHIESVANQLLKHKVNFWKTAMFCALRDSDWFCKEGVLNVRLINNKETI